MGKALALKLADLCLHFVTVVEAIWFSELVSTSWNGLKKTSLGTMCTKGRVLCLACNWDWYNKYCSSFPFYCYLKITIIIVLIIFTPSFTRRNQIIESPLLMLLEPDRHHEDKLRLVLAPRVNSSSL